MKQAAGCARFAGMAIGSICVLCFVLFPEAIASLFIDEAETVRLSAHFLRAASLAVPFMICNFQMGYTFQAMGKGFLALLLTLCRQGIVNITLMYLLNRIFGLEGLIWAQLVTDIVIIFVSFALYAKTCKKLTQESETGKTVQ